MPVHGPAESPVTWMVFIQEILAYLVDVTTLPSVMFGKGAVPYGASAGQYILNMTTLPNLTPKGEDIVAAVMTIVHNGIVAVAQISTLLPYNAL